MCPCHDPLSYAYLSDGQALLEKSLMSALIGLSGSDIQYGPGRLDKSTYASPVQHYSSP
jgi:hypothetical protein